MKKIKYFLITMLLTLFLCNAGIASTFYFTDANETELWRDMNNWNLSWALPTSADYVKVQLSDVNCVIDSSTAAEAYDVYIENGGTIVMTGGTLDIARNMAIAWSGEGNFILQDGDVNVPSLTRIADDANTAGILQIEGGLYKTYQLNVGYPGSNEPNKSAKVNLYGGTLEIARNAPGGIQYSVDHTPENPYDDGIDMRGTGTLKWAGDNTGAINNLITNVYLYTGESGKSLELSYIYDTDETTVLYTVVSVIDEPEPVASNITFLNSSSDNYWTTAENWSLRIPLDIDNAYVTLEEPNQCVIDAATTAVCASLGVGHSSFGGDGTLAMTGGTLTVGTDKAYIGTGSTGYFKLDDGNVYVELDTRLGISGGNGTLEINGGTYSTQRLWLPLHLNDDNVGKLVINGGIFEIRWDADSGLLIEYNSNTDGEIEINGNGVLKCAGDKVGRLNYFKNAGLIYTTDPNKELAISFDGTWTTMKAVEYKATDLDKNFNVDVNDLSIFVHNWLENIVLDAINPNPVIFAPEIDPIVVDGDLSDWTNFSDWAEFGKWFPDGNGLEASTTMAQYAWDTDANMFYIGVETTEPLDPNLRLEVGGLMGDISDISATVSDSNQATQILFVYDGSGIEIINQVGGTVSGISASGSSNGSTVTFEIAIPIYSDWTAGSGLLDLEAGMDIYVYANLADTGFTAADSQCADGVYLFYGNKEVTAVSTAVRLLNSLPATCADIPATKANPANFGGDCFVNLEDLAIFTEDWLINYNPF